MSGDLISRKATVKMLHDYADLKCFNVEVGLASGILKSVSMVIDHKIVPTAYDVDKVVKSINEIGRIYCDSVKCDIDCCNCEHNCLMMAITNAVKSGGVADE